MKNNDVIKMLLKVDNVAYYVHMIANILLWNMNCGNNIETNDGMVCAGVMIEKRNNVVTGVPEHTDGLFSSFILLFSLRNVTCLLASSFFVLTQYWTDTDQLLQRPWP